MASRLKRLINNSAMPDLFLRRAQFNLAKKNASMAIFLGKNYLGQSDRGYTDEELAKAIDREIGALRASK
ncbi:MAG TPA: hypothetical protein VLB68_24370 [Pyrinomonadaceae bacterium]|nr:hypothetical protein [Pyrinomonadaceae bacterium]